MKYYTEIIFAYHRKINLGSTRETGCVACTEGIQKIFWWEILKGEEHLGKLSVDRSLMLKRIIRHSLPIYGLRYPAE